MKKILIAIFLVFCSFGISLFAQTTDTLLVEQYQAIVLKYHPLIKSAELFDDISESYLLKGRGALDPKFYSSFDAKNFKSTNYFQRWNSEVKIPTKYPVDVSLGYEDNSGVFLNNDEVLPGNGLMYGTISVSVLRGLMFDQQRFNIEESKLLANKSRIEQKMAIREILMQSIKAYVEWSAAYFELKVLEEYQERVIDRHQFVINLFENGDKPAIDTLESRINLNTAEKDLLDAREKLIWKTQKLNLFLWDESGKPLALLDSIAPEALLEVVEGLELESMFVDPVWENDLSIQKKSNQLDQLALQNRLEREQLKPQLDLKVNTIHSLGDNDLAYSYSVNDYKLGASVAIPLRNRKTRGQLRLNEALIEQNKFDQLLYINELGFKYQALLNNQILKLQSIEVVEEKLKNSELLYEAEQIKFQLGESSVFLLNSRERKLLEAQKDYLKILKDLGFVFSEIYYLKLGQQ